MRRCFFCCRLRRHHCVLAILLTCLIPLVLFRSTDRLLGLLHHKPRDIQPLIRHHFLEKVHKYGQRPFQQDNGLRKVAEVTHSHKIIHDESFNKLYARDKDSHPEFLQRVASAPISECRGKFQGFLRLFAVLHDVVIDMQHCSGPKGGEKFEDLMNQPEEVEFLRYTPGFFTMNCEERISYRFKGSSHLNKWMDVLQQGPEEPVDEVVHDFTIAITRYEYVNMYHTMTDFYNAFLVMAFCNQTQHQTNILILDGHPLGGLDSVWGTVFNSMTRVSQLKAKTRFTNLAFGILGYQSPMYVSEKLSHKLPLRKEFREFFLSSYNLPLFYPLNCDKLSILLIWRRNYVAHPRNPFGRVERKIMNEQQLVEGIQNDYPTAKVRGVQMDRFEMADQVKMFAECDILIGVHGAALTEMVFMHERRGIIEIFPSYVEPMWRTHFVKMAQESNMIYKRWVNKNPTLEHSDYRTEVPPGEIVKMIREVKTEMCPEAM